LLQVSPSTYQLLRKRKVINSNPLEIKVSWAIKG
jgi:hypothetical protein